MQCEATQARRARHVIIVNKTRYSYYAPLVQTLHLWMGTPRSAPCSRGRALLCR